MRFLARFCLMLPIFVLALVAFGLGAMAVAGPAAATTYASANGQGSTYAALAFQTWTQKEQVQGLNVNYTATGSPAGLQAYQANTADFAGTEAEYSELYADTPGTANSHVPRGFAYTPDVAGAVAIMYNVALDPTGHNSVNYLQLSRLTVARIFLGIITNWDSPTITADNKGLVLPNEPIVLDFRSGQSGTTALFYDFVAKTDPSQYAAWAKRNSFPANSRIWEVDDGTGGFPPSNAQGFNQSTEQASSVAGTSGLWSIGYDEFGYSKVYKDNVAWIENASGAWVQPYALNIAAALQTAVLAPDTSQTLIGVYASTNALAYPISAYSYILYQCAPTPSRGTCKTAYTNPGITATMAKFMRYIACTGQVTMATIGYSPLPTQLSQFMANAIGYMTGQAAPTLTVKDCANPQFKGGNLGVGADPPKDPVTTVASEAPGGSSSPTPAKNSGPIGIKNPGQVTTNPNNPSLGPTNSNPTGGTTVGSTATTVPKGPHKVVPVALNHKESKSVGGGSTATNWLSPAPVAYVGPVAGSGSPWPLLALLFVLLVPVCLFTLGGRRRRSGRITSSSPEEAIGTDGRPNAGGLT